MPRADGDGLDSIHSGHGRGGSTSSSVEIVDKGGVGVEMDMDKVPQRETGMTAYEIMPSESQERMLMVLKPARGGCEEDFRQMGS